MKKYLKITGEMLWMQDEISRVDIAGVKTNMYDAIVNTQTGEFFNADKNKWEES